MKGKITGRQTRARLQFWCESWLETIALILVVAICIYLFLSFGRSAGSAQDKLQEFLMIFPYYIMMTGMFGVFLVGIGYFQTYFQILLSMNSTRKRILGNILFHLALMQLSILGIMGLIWKLAGGDAADAGISLLPLLTGSMFLAGACSVLLGTVMIRWGKIGMILFTLICTLIGGCAGVCTVSISAEQVSKWVQMLIGMSESVLNCGVVAAGVIGYLLAGLFAARMTRKIEVRV